MPITMPERGKARDVTSISSGRAFRRGWFVRWRVDPCGGWFVRRRRCFVDEALRVFAERVIEDLLAGGVNGIDLAVMHLVRGHETDPGMVMVPVVPVEELTAETPGVLDAAKALREPRLIFQGLEDGVDGPDGIGVPQYGS
jgi:hypothetical protein